MNMADLKIPKISNKSQFLFKNKLNKSRNSKQKLMRESLLMISLSFLLVFLSYLIPNKYSLFSSFVINFKMSLNLFISLMFALLKLFLVIFTVILLTVSLILLFGAVLRVFRVTRIKTKKFYINNSI